MTALRLRMSGVMVLAGLTVGALATAGPWPPLGSWTDAVAWYDRVGPSAASMALLRGIGVLGAAWMLLGAVLQLGASLPVGGGFRWLADVASPRLLRRLAQGAAGLSVTAGLVVPAAADDPPGTAVMEVVEDPAPEVAIPDVPDVPEVPDEVVVAAGDSFWTLAVEAVTAAEGRQPAAHEVVDYWERLIEANRTRLIVPDNPDLLYPDQALVLPPVRSVG